MEQKEIFKKSLEASKKFVNSLTKEQLCDLMKVFDDYEIEQCNMHVVVSTSKCCNVDCKDMAQIDSVYCEFHGSM